MRLLIFILISFQLHSQTEIDTIRGYNQFVLPNVGDNDAIHTVRIEKLDQTSLMTLVNPLSRLVSISDLGIGHYLVTIEQRGLIIYKRRVYVE